MKIVTIGDLHGKGLKYWSIPIMKTILGEYDKAIFLGDYCDSFTATNEEIKDNLIQLINLKILFPDKIILLWGNHEGHYAWVPPHVYNPYKCSGFRPEMHWDLFPLFQEHQHLFQLAYQEGSYLWTHAGLSKGWWNNNFKSLFEGLSNVARELNESFLHMEPSLFHVSKLRGGSQTYGGPLWADKLETWNKSLPGLHQIVGHTAIERIMSRSINESTSITFCDCLDHIDDYHVVEIKEERSPQEP